MCSATAACGSTPAAEQEGFTPAGDDAATLDSASIEVAADSAMEAAPSDTNDATVITATVADIDAIALASSCYKYAWKDRGQAPKGYMKGVAETFARAVCNPTRSDVVLTSKPKTTDDVHDALSWYASN